MNTIEKVKRPAGRPKRPPMPPTDVVRQVRDALKLTQIDFAQAMKCTELAIRKMENERRLPGSRALKDNFSKLAKKAGVEVTP